MYCNRSTILEVKKSKFEEKCFTLHCDLGLEGTFKVTHPIPDNCSGPHFAIAASWYWLGGPIFLDRSRTLSTVLDWWTSLTASIPHQLHLNIQIPQIQRAIWLLASHCWLASRRNNDFQIGIVLIHCQQATSKMPPNDEHSGENATFGKWYFWEHWLFRLWTGASCVRSIGWRVGQSAMSLSAPLRKCRIKNQ